jgi:hypothetical protein
MPPDSYRDELQAEFLLQNKSNFTFKPENKGQEINNQQIFFQLPSSVS